MMIFLRDGVSWPDDFRGHPSNRPASGRATCSANHSAEKNKKKVTRERPGEVMVTSKALRPQA
jgi:hypothetical protein